MGSSRAIPIVVGVGDIKNRSQKIEDAIEPMKLMLQAIQAAIKDTGLSSSAGKEFQASIDSVGVVNTWSWNYSDLPGLISENLGIKPKYKGLSHHGGDSPAKFLDEAARRISFRESKVAIITGGEALASRKYLEFCHITKERNAEFREVGAYAAAGKSPPWTEADESVKSVSVSDVSRMKESDTDFTLSSASVQESELVVGMPPLLGTGFANREKGIGTLHSVGLPIHIYPLYENAFRAHRGQSIQDNNKESAELYADFAKVAEGNPLAWNYGKPAATEKDIGTVSKKNRMICFPCMSANLTCF